MHTIVGYGAKTTSDYATVVDLDSKIQKGLSDPATAIQFGKCYGISQFLIHLDRYNPAVAQKWKSIAYELEGNVLFETKGTIFLSLGNH